MKVDDYIQKVVKLGDEGSDLLAKLAAPTLKNSEHADYIEGVGAVLRFPKKYAVVVHSAGGDPYEKDLAAHSASLVDRLVEQAKAINATPIGFADVIDSNTGDLIMLETIMASLKERANHYNLSILNGENAILGHRINKDIQANVSGTMISLIPKDSDLAERYQVLNLRGEDELVRYAIFYHNNMAVFINCDGIGTKTEFYERAGKHKFGINDFFAMNFDDASKLGAIIKAISGVVETKGNIPYGEIEVHAFKLAGEMSIISALQHEIVGDRLNGYTPDAATYNVSGSVVSLIDEERLKNPLKPSAGEYLVAVTGTPNPRSNGITDKRRIMIDLLGNNWHETEAGLVYLNYLSTPSTILYPLFKELIDNGLASSVYHMSGGAFNGKLAKPIAKHNLYVEIDDLFEPHPIELELMKALKTELDAAYTKWPLGNDGFWSTNKPDEAIKVAKIYGLDAKVVGVFQKAENGKTGVELKAFNKEKVYFSGN